MAELSHPCLRPCWGKPLRMSGWNGVRKLESWGYQMVKKSWRQLSSFWYNAGVWQTDRRTRCCRKDRR